MFGGALAGALACPLYGDHAEWLDPLLPWGDKHHDKNVACHSAVCHCDKCMWMDSVASTATSQKLFNAYCHIVYVSHFSFCLPASQHHHTPTQILFGLIKLHALVGILWLPNMFQLCCQIKKSDEAHLVLDLGMYTLELQMYRSLHCLVD